MIHWFSTKFWGRRKGQGGLLKLFWEEKKFEVSPANVHFRSVCELIRVIKKEVNYFHYMHLLHMFEISLGQIIFFCKVTYIFVTGKNVYIISLNFEISLHTYTPIFLINAWYISIPLKYINIIKIHEYELALQTFSHNF